MKTNIGLSNRAREGVGVILERLLADEHVLYLKTRNFHWNVTGARFNDLHKFFEAQYDQLEETIDEVAERLRALGGVARGSMKEFLKLARLEEAPGALRGTDRMLTALLEDHEALIRALREDLVTADEIHGDAGTADLLTGLMAAHEKMAWMLRSFLK